MSYIDTFDHQYVGSFAGLPIYYSRTPVAGDGGAEFCCGPDNLVIGGGCGEHSALVLHRLDCLAMRFLLHAVEEKEDDARPRAVTEQFGDFPIWDYLDVPFSVLFVYADWSVSDYHFFYERCTSTVLDRPFGVDDYLSFEDWLAISLGELVWYSFPELIDNLDPIRSMYPKLRPFSWNVTIPPPGYPQRYGRRIEGNGIVWGDNYFKLSTDPSK